MEKPSGELFKKLNVDRKKIEVIKSEGKLTLLLNGRPYMNWSNEDEEAPRIAVVQLYELGLITQEELAEAFQVHIKSVYNYINAYKLSGIRGLMSRMRGPKNKWKVTPQIRAKIMFAVLREGLCEYESIQEYLERVWKQEVSIASIRQVLIENGLVEERFKMNDLGKQQKELFRKEDEEQLEIDFSCNTGYQRAPSVSDQEEKNCNDSCLSLEVKDRSFYSPAQRIYLDQLEQGGYSAYAGGLLFTPLLERNNFLPIIKRVIDIEKHEGYSLDELCLTLLYFDLFRFKSMEDFKTVYSEEFGILIGRLYNPSIFTLRRFLHKVKELGKGEELIDEFAKEYLKQRIAKWGVLYIDSHFLPYYGMYTVTMGWHGVRKIPMKGSYNFLAVDEKFIPILFLIRSSSEDLLKKIPEIILKGKKLAKEAGIDEEGTEDLIVIFDREGYSAELFRILDGREDEYENCKAKFISWAKYSDRWVDDIEDEKFNKTVIVTYEIEEPEEIRYFETERNMKKYGKIRTIVIESGKDKNRAAIYTNDNDIKAEKIIQLICRRWGQENLIKELMMKHLINYFPGYEIDEMDEQPVVENPKIKGLKKKRIDLKSQLSHIKSKFGHEVIEEMANEANWDEIKKKHLMTRVEIESLNSEITLLGFEIDKLPKRIRFDEAHDGKKLVEFNYEKKRFLDCIKVFAYNIGKQMCDLLLNYYDVKKEIYPALSMIIKRGGYVKLEDGELKVRLGKFRNPEIDYAARHLCEYLNQVKPLTLDKFRLPIHYEVA